MNYRFKQIDWRAGMGETVSLHGFIDDRCVIVMEERNDYVRATDKVLCHVFGVRFSFDTFEQAKEQLDGRVSAYLEGLCDSAPETATESEPEPETLAVDFEGMTKVELLTLAKARSLQVDKSMTKEDIIVLLQTA